MTTIGTARPDVSSVLNGLKDFQRDSVEYIFKRLYTDSDPVSRFLVADEVGLGKTLVARGVIAKAIDHLWETIDRIDVIYICSNQDIARQNIDRLNITENQNFQLASRATLLPLEVHQLKNESIFGEGAITRSFDSDGNLTSKSHYGVTTHFTYYGSGNIKSITDARGYKTKYYNYWRGVWACEVQPVDIFDPDVTNDLFNAYACKVNEPTGSFIQVRQSTDSFGNITTSNCFYWGLSVYRCTR